MTCCIYFIKKLEPASAMLKSALLHFLSTALFVTGLAATMSGCSHWYTGYMEGASPDMPLATVAIVEVNNGCRQFTKGAFDIAAVDHKKNFLSDRSANARHVSFHSCYLVFVPGDHVLSLRRALREDEPRGSCPPEFPQYVDLTFHADPGGRYALRSSVPYEGPAVTTAGLYNLQGGGPISRVTGQYSCRDFLLVNPGFWPPWPS